MEYTHLEMMHGSSFVLAVMPVREANTNQKYKLVILKNREGKSGEVSLKEALQLMLENL